MAGNVLKTAQALDALAALGHASRLAIFRALVQAGSPGLSVGVIAEKLKVAGPTLSFHLKDLAAAGLIVAQQEGRFIFYRANYAQMNALIAYLTENCCEGDACGVPCGPSATPGRRKRVAA